MPTCEFPSCKRRIRNRVPGGPPGYGIRGVINGERRWVQVCATHERLLAIQNIMEGCHVDNALAVSLNWRFCKDPGVEMPWVKEAPWNPAN